MVPLVSCDCRQAWSPPPTPFPLFLPLPRCCFCWAVAHTRQHPRGSHASEGEGQSRIGPSFGTEGNTPYHRREGVVRRFPRHSSPKCQSRCDTGAPKLEYSSNSHLEANLGTGPGGHEQARVCIRSRRCDARGCSQNVRTCSGRRV